MARGLAGIHADAEYRPRRDPGLDAEAGDPLQRRSDLELRSQGRGALRPEELPRALLRLPLAAALLDPPRPSGTRVRRRAYVPREEGGAARAAPGRLSLAG